MLEFPTKVDGISVEPAAEYNNLASELKTMLSSLGIAFNPSSVIQLAQAVETYSLIGKYFADGGTANSYVLSAVPSTRKDTPSYYTGIEVYFLPANTNTGASTVNVAGLGAKTIVDRDGSSALTGGEIVVNELCHLVYDGTNFRLDTSMLVGYTFDPTFFNVIGSNVSLNTGVGATDWNYKSGWFTMNTGTLITKAHGISLTFPTEGLEILLLWRASSGGSYIVPIGLLSSGTVGSRLSFDGTNIYINGLTNFNLYTDSSGTQQTAGNGEGYLFARKQV